MPERTSWLAAATTASTGRGTASAAFSRSRRWTGYVASWFVTYAAAISVVIWAHGSVLLAGLASGLILAVAMICAGREARA